MAAADAELARQRAAEALRTGYGKLVAYLASRSRDLDAVQDALSDAFAAALENWPKVGVPERPEAWLLSAARLRLIDRHRRQEVRRRARPTLALAAEEAADHSERSSMFPDRRLELMFACAHPAIDPAVRTPLILQTVLGMDAGRIAGAFLVPSKTMGQRLVRAKRKIKMAGVPFEIPEPSQRGPRLDAVLEAVYAAYASEPSPSALEADRGRGLGEEAVYLARLLAQWCPEDAEVLGLLALLLQCEARRDAGRNADGRFVPLAEQDPSRWQADLLDEASELLQVAASLRDIGPFQLEAAIQMVHSRRLYSGRIDWSEIVRLYRGLIAIGPSVGAQVGLAAALGQAGDPAGGLQVLEAIDHPGLGEHAPYWAVKADLLSRMNRPDESRQAYAKAAGLTSDPAVRRFLEGRSPEA